MRSRRQDALAVDLLEFVAGRCYDRTGLPALASDVRIVACLCVEARISCVTSANHSTRGPALAVFAHFMRRVPKLTPSMVLFNGDTNVSKKVFELLLV